MPPIPVIRTAMTRMACTILAAWLAFAARALASCHDDQEDAEATSAHCLLNRRLTQPKPKVADIQQGGFKDAASHLEVCEDAFYVHKSPTPCSYPMQTSFDEEDTHNKIYRQLAETSEQIYECLGLRTEAKVDIDKWKCPNRRQKTGTIQAEYSGVLDTPWKQNSQKMESMRNSIGACLENNPMALADPADLYNNVARCSDAWHLMHAFANNTMELEWWPGISAIVRQHHTFLKHAQYLLKRSSASPACASCLMFPKPAELICGGLQPYAGLVGDLELLHHDGRNLMYHEHGQLIDFTPYLPLPASYQFDQSILESGRKILLVAGANGFYRAPKYLIDMYSPYLKFDTVYMWDPDPDLKHIPESYVKGLKFVQNFLQVGSRDETDLVTFMQKHVKEQDYVVLMYDVDEADIFGPTMEWGFLADLLSQKQRLVDELYIELHYSREKTYWGYDRHSGREAVELLVQMRDKCGFAVHAWP